MADMNVSMRLTLTDLGTPGVRAFMNLLTQLEGVASSVSGKINTLQNEIRGAGAAATAAANSQNRHNASLAQADARMAQASVGAANLGRAIGLMTLNVGNAVAHVSQLVGSLGGLTGANAALNAQTGTQNLANGLSAANTQANSLGSTLKGVIQLWGALEIKKGATASAKDAIEYQTTETKLLNMRIPEGERRELIEASKRTSKAVPQYDIDESLQLALDLRNVTGTVAHAVELLTPFAKAIYSMKLAMPSDKQWRTSDSVMVGKALEQRGAALDPVRMQKELDMVVKIVTATQGRVDPSQLLGNLQYARGGLGANFDIEFLPVMAAMIERIRASGGNGGQIGTGLTTLQQAIVGGIGSEKAQKARADLGLIDPSKLVWNVNGNINQQKSDLTMVGARLFLQNPDSWIQQFVVPALARSGVDMKDAHSVNLAVNKLFPNRMAADQVSTLINQRELLMKDVGNITQAAGSEEQYANNIKTARANLDAFHSQLKNLGIVLGTTLLPVITAVAKAFTGMFELLAGFFTAFPATTTFLAWALAIATIGLAIAGLKNVFGILSGVGTLLGLVGISATTAGAAVTGSVAATTGALGGIGAAVLAFVTTVAKGFLRLVPLVGLLVLAWDFAGLATHLSVGGKTIQDWATFVSDWAVSKFRSAWSTIGGIVNSIRPGTISMPGSGVKDNGWNSNSNGNNPRNTHGDMNTGSWSQVGDKLFPRTQSPGKKPKEGGGSGARFANYDAELDAAKNAFKLAEDFDKRTEDSQKRKYAANLISIDAYHDEKLAMLKGSVANEIAILEREKSAYNRIGDKSGSARTSTEITLKQRSLASGEENIALERSQAVLKLDKEELDLKRSLLQNEGQRRLAELMRLQFEEQAKISVLVLNKRITQEEGDMYMARVKSGIDAQTMYPKIATLQQAYAAKVTEINDAEKNGTLSATAAEDRKLALMKQEAAELDVLIAKMRELAQASGNDKLVGELDQQSVKNNSVKNLLSPELTTQLKSAQSGFGNFFQSVLSGSASVGSAIKKFGSDITTTFINLASKRLGDMLFDSLFGGSVGGTGGAGGGGGFGSLFSGIGNLFSSFSGFDMYASAGNSTLMSLFGNGIGFLDSGTDRVPRDMLSMIHKDEIVVPAYDADRVRGGSKERPLNITNNFTIPATMSTASQSQIAAAAGSGINRALRRNG